MAEGDIGRVFEKIASYENDIIEFLSAITAVPALSPLSEGEGEDKKAQLLGEYLKKYGFDEVEHHDAPDDRVPSGKRPNLVVWLR